MTVKEVCTTLRHPPVLVSTSCSNGTVSARTQELQRCIPTLCGSSGSSSSRPRTDAASRPAPPFQSCTSNHIDCLSRIPHANELHVEIPLAAPTERDGADTAELPGHPRPVPCLVKRPVRLGTPHHHYPSVGDRVAGAPGSVPPIESRGDGCDQRHDDGRESKPEGKPQHEDQHWSDADEPSDTNEQRERRTEELDRGIGFLVRMADLGQDGSQRRGSLTPYEPLIRPKVWLNEILRVVADHCDQCVDGIRESVPR